MSGPIPAELGNLGALGVLWLHDNQLSGPIPATFANLDSLVVLRVSGNNICVPRSDTVFTAWLDGVDHDTNGLPSCPEAAGDRAALEALYNATDGPNWMDNTNWLDSTVALGEWYGVSTDASGRVVGLDLSGRYDGERGEWIRHGLSGEIPPELGSLANLGALYLHGKQSLGLDSIRTRQPRRTGGAETSPRTTSRARFHPNSATSRNWWSCTSG